MPNDSSKKSPPPSLRGLAQDLTTLASAIETAAAVERVPAVRAEVRRVAREVQAGARILDSLAGAAPPPPPSARPKRRTGAPKTPSLRAARQADPAAKPLPLRVLVVDDDRAQRDLTCRQLTSEGLDALDLAGAIGLRAAILKYRPDVVVLDVRMPVIDGPEAIRTVRASDPRVRFVLYSALPEDELRKVARDAQADAWLMKTGDASRLAACVRSVVGPSGR